MTKRKKDDDYAAPQLADEVGRWLAHLAAERRMSAKTVEAYGRDMRQFLAFLAGHFGTRVTLARLCDLAPSDVRAFMALRRGADSQCRRARIRGRKYLGTGSSDLRGARGCAGTDGRVSRERDLRTAGLYRITIAPRLLRSAPCFGMLIPLYGILSRISR